MGNSLQDEFSGQECIRSHGDDVLDRLDVKGQRWLEQTNTNDRRLRRDGRNRGLFRGSERKSYIL